MGTLEQKRKRVQKEAAVDADEWVQQTAMSEVDDKGELWCGHSQRRYKLPRTRVEVFPHANGRHTRKRVVRHTWKRPGVMHEMWEVQIPPDARRIEDDDGDAQSLRVGRH
jgi:hypothetical protein